MKKKPTPPSTYDGAISVLDAAKELGINRRALFA